MRITKQKVVGQLANYLNHSISKNELIAWCEEAMQEGAFENAVVREITARLGLMNAKNFEVSYEDLSLMLEQLGHKLKVEVV
ncbi:MAG: hypothetical protein ABI623_05130 [bacterium]